jgi:hypothetical protein
MHVRLAMDVYTALQKELRRPHPFAAERVAFAYGRQAMSSKKSFVIIADFDSVEDDDYEDDTSVGARIGAVAINKALRRAAALGAAAFHVHAHLHSGRPWFSKTDLRELPPVMEPFMHVVPTQPRGILVMSDDDCAGLVWRPREVRPVTLLETVVVGAPMQFLGIAHE